MSKQYPKSRLPGPAVMFFELEYEQEVAKAAQQKALEAATVRVSYDAQTFKVAHQRRPKKP